MPGFVEPVVYIFRAGPEATEYGKPFTFSATVVVIDHDTVELRGAARASDDPQTAGETFRSMRRCLKALGFKRARWERRKKSGASIWVTVKL